jgi:hypothetical protein
MEQLEASTSDKDLFELVLWVRSSPHNSHSQEWLRKVIASDLISDVPFLRARAVVLRGFNDTGGNIDWFEEINDEERPWERAVLEGAAARSS